MGIHLDKKIGGEKVEVKSFIGAPREEEIEEILYRVFQKTGIETETYMFVLDAVDLLLEIVTDKGVDWYIDNSTSLAKINEIANQN